MNTLQSNYSTSINGLGATALIDASDSVLSTLKLLANGSNFRTIIREAFGDQFQTGALNTLGQQWSTGDFSGLPQVEIVSGTTLGGALAGYAQSNNKIYLSQEFLAQNLSNPSALKSVLLEELGHFIDAQINVVDAQGDEGAIFRELLSGLGLTPQQLQALRSEDDHRIVNVDGVSTPIEAATPPVNNLGVLASSVTPLLSAIRAELASQVLNNLPLLDNLNLQTYVNQFIGSTLEQALTSELNQITTQSTANVQQALFNALNGLGLLQDLGTNGVGSEDVQVTETADRIEFQFKIGQVFKPSLTLSDNLGLPNLGLDLNGGITSDLNLGLTVGFGVDDSDQPNEAFFVNTGITNEFQVGLNSQFKDINNQPLSLDGTLGFLKLNATDNGSNFTANFAGDLTGLGTGGFVKSLNLNSLEIVNPALEANADLKLKLLTSLNAALPSIGADLNLTGLKYNSTTPVTSAPTVAFDNVYLDAGSFFSGFIKDVFGSIQTVTKPFEPIIETLKTELPLLNLSLIDLATLLSEPGSPLGTGTISPETLDFLEFIVEVVAVIDSIPTNAGNLKLDLGNFNLGGTDIRNTNVTTVNPTITNPGNPLNQLNSAGNAEITTFLKALNDLVSGGTSSQDVKTLLPILSDPSNIFKALLGQQVDLFKYETPRLDFGLKVASPLIPIVGPVAIKFEGSASVGAQLALGYDTQGLIDYKNSGFSDPSKLLDGFFAAKPTTGDNLTLGGQIDALAGVSFGFLSLFIGGGVGLTVGWNLDGKVRGSTIADTDKALCLFNAKGELAAIIFGQFELDFGFFSITKRLDLADIKLADFSQDCDSGAPNYNVLGAEPDPNSPLAAKLGEQGIINRKGTDNSDTITVQYISGSFNPDPKQSTLRVEVQGLNPVLQYPNVTLVIIDGKAGNDSIKFVGVDAPGQLSGGEGNDTIVSGGADDFLTGGAGNDSLDGGGSKKNGNTAIYSDAKTGIFVSLIQNRAIDDGHGTRDILANIQNIEGSDKRDYITGNNQRNILTGGIGDDTLLGNGGDDVLESGAGADVINGGDGTDTITYFASTASVFVNLSDANFSGPSPTSSVSLWLPANRGFGGDANGDRVFNVENVQGSVFGDILVARDQAGNVDGFFGDDILVAGSGADTLNGGGGIDWVSYRRSNAGVSVNLKTGAGSGGFATGDSLVRLRLENGNITEISSFENLEGSLNNDTLVGDIQYNIIHGLAGADNIQADEGFDTLMGGAGADTLNGGSGLDWADYSNSPGAVQVFLSGGGTGSDAQGDSLNNIENLIGSDSSDDLLGDAGNNEIDPRLSNRPGDAFVDDFVNGGDGVDRLIVDYSREDVGVGMTGGYDLGSTITGSFNRNNSSNTSSIDAIQFISIERLKVIGTTKADSINGGAGDDIIATGAGDDTIYGGRGKNYILADDGNDFVVDQNNSDQILGRFSNSFSVLDGGAGIDTLSIDLAGKDFDINLISTNPLQENPNQKLTLPDGTAITRFEVFEDINTGDGDDLLIQLGRVDNVFDTDLGNDTINAGLGFDQIDGGFSSRGEGYGDDLLIVDYSTGDVGSGMFTESNPFGGNDDTFDGRYYRNDSNGELLDEVLFREFEQSQITGTSQDDVIISYGRSQDTLVGNDGNDFLDGLRLSDSLSGGAGNDTLRGFGVFSDDDFEIDTLTGGSGADNFVLGGFDLNRAYYNYTDRSDYALITDFNAVEGDTLTLYADPRGYATTINGGNTELYAPSIAGQLYLVAVLQGVTNFDLNAPYIKYTSDTTPLIPVVPPPGPTPLQTLATQTLSIASTADPVSALTTPTAAPAAPVSLAAPAAATAFAVTQNNDTAALLTQFLGTTTGLSNFSMELTGDARAFGTFVGDPFGLGSGLVLSTGRVVDLAGTNTVDGGFNAEQNVKLNFIQIGSIGGTGVYRADLFNLGFDLNSLTIQDSGSGVGGSPGKVSGFDLDGIKLSNTLLTSASGINSLPGLNVFDFSPLDTVLTPGTQRSTTSPILIGEFSGTTNGLVNNGIATLAQFDAGSAIGDPGSVSLGDGGKIGFDLISPVSTQGPLYLYIGESGNNGEVAAGNITVSSRGLFGTSDLSTDFGLLGAENDSISTKIEFDADGTAQYVYFQFVFSSEEFIEYAGSDFNDAFSLKLNGLNLAQLSDGSQVTINNITPNVFSSNPDFIYNPAADGPAANDTKLDGYTKVLTFAGPIIPNAKNTLEIQIADIRDGLLDSAVFLKAGTFGVTPPPDAGGEGGGGVVIPGAPGVSIDLGDDGVNVAEGGTKDTFTVSLDGAPTSNVTITITPDAQLNLGNGGATPITLTFTPGNAHTPQTVTVSAVDDTVIEDFHIGRFSFTTSSSDPAYNGLTLEPLGAVIEDNDTIVSPNIINGTPGRDTLVGTSGNDQITGLAGADTITGGDGADIFRYISDRDAGDIIKDFTVGVDKIRVTELLAGLGYKGTNPIADGYVLFVTQGSNTIVQLDPDGLAGTKVPRNFITVENVSLSALNNPNNFVF
jgi:Ca2+-binding RTX toxin-like protein